MRIPGGSLVLAPGSSVVHQHPVWNSTTLKRFFELLPHRFAASSAIVGQRDQVAAVIVEHGQGADRLGPPLRPFEVHLPQLIRLFSFKALLRAWVWIGLPIQM